MAKIHSETVVVRFSTLCKNDQIPTNRVDEEFLTQLQTLLDEAYDGTGLVVEAHIQPIKPMLLNEQSDA